MRSLLAATALLLVATSTPSMARDYPWCARTPVTDFNPSCAYTSYNQCMATLSGIGGDCMKNPLLAFGQQPRPRKGRHVSDWDHDWNRRW